MQVTRTKAKYKPKNPGAPRPQKNFRPEIQTRIPKWTHLIPLVTAGFLI